MVDEEIANFLRVVCLWGAVLSYVGLVHALCRSVGIFSGSEK